MNTVSQSAPESWAFIQPGASLPPWPTDETVAFAWSKSFDELHRIRDLRNDWDGEGSEAPPPGLVDGAVTLAQWLESEGTPSPERILAGQNGTIYFEWHSQSGYVEIEVTSARDAEYRWVPKDTDATKVMALSRRS